MGPQHKRVYARLRRAMRGDYHGDVMTRSSAAKKIIRSPVPGIPTFAERIEALREDVEDEVNRRAEEKRPPSVPAGWMRQHWMARTGNIFDAYLESLKEFPD